MKIPDGYVILKLEDGKDTIYKLFSCWYGGYLDSDTWRLNSGITKITKENDYYIVEGNTDTVYKIWEGNSIKLSNYCSAILDELLETAKTGNVKVTLINIETCKKEIENVSKN